MENTEAKSNVISADVNRFPSVTWHHLHINHGRFEGSIDGGIDFTSCTLPDSVRMKKIAVGELKLPAQIGTQMGPDFDSSVERIAAERNIPVNFISIGSGASLSEALTFTFRPDSSKNLACETVIFAEEGSSASLVFEYLDGGNGSGVFGHRIRVYCAPHSSLNLSTVNLLGVNVHHYNGIGVLQEEESNFELTEIDLGAGDTVTGSMIVQKGYRAESSVHTGYFMSGKQSVDENYIVRQFGKETKSAFNSNGVLDGNARKAWRGTIDFPSGCVDAVGDEQENVLLLSPDVVNKSLPVILCGEESVDGRHGSTIGKLNESELFYLETRGIDREIARRMMIDSKINSIARNVPSEETRKKISDSLSSL